jgi:hypothetical protein
MGSGDLRRRVARDGRTEAALPAEALGVELPALRIRTDVGGACAMCLATPMSKLLSAILGKASGSTQGTE